MTHFPYLSSTAPNTVYSDTVHTRDSIFQKHSLASKAYSQRRTGLEGREEIFLRVDTLKPFQGDAYDTPIHWNSSRSVNRSTASSSHTCMLGDRRVLTVSRLSNIGSNHLIEIEALIPQDRPAHCISSITWQFHRPVRLVRYPGERDLDVRTLRFSVRLTPNHTERICCEQLGDTCSKWVYDKVYSLFPTRCQLVCN